MTTPAVEVRTFAVTIPAGTAQASPVTVPITMPAREVLWVHWTVPPGAAGLMGWALTMSGGVNVIPTGSGFIVTDDDSDTWNLAQQPDSGAWEVTGYNTDVYDHKVILNFGLGLVGVSTAPPALTPSASLSSSPPAVITAS